MPVQSLIFIPEPCYCLVFTCGNNNKGQLGVGDNGGRLVPTLVTGQLQCKKTICIAANSYHTLCAIG